MTSKKSAKHHDDIELIDRTNQSDNDGQSFDIADALHDDVTKDITWSQIIGGSIGNILEWYDFAIFGFLAAEIGYNFFPSTSNNRALELIKAYGVFAGAFIMRPVGGFVFGALGDKMGRKKALQLSMILMFFATFSIGCLPTEKTIGIWAPLLLTFCRLFQGVSVGGQLVGSILFIVESARPNKRGFYGALAMTTAVLGGVCASWMISLLNLIYSPQEMKEYGWRIPFLASFIIAIIGCISQRHMAQSHEFLSASKQNKLRSNPIKDALKHHWMKIILITIIVIPWSAGGYVNFTWLPTYLQSQYGIEHAFLINSFVMAFKMGVLVLSGYIADRYISYTNVMKFGIIFLMIWSFPAYYLMYKMYIINKSTNVWPFIVADFGTVIGLGIFGGPQQKFMVYSIDDVVVRYSCIGIGYNLSQALFGGTAPLIGSALALMNFCYVGVYLAVFSGISAFTLHFWKKHSNEQTIQIQKNDFAFDKIESWNDA